jgi:protocatechuate 3,4-dioxygenase beta subunit
MTAITASLKSMLSRCTTYRSWVEEDLGPCRRDSQPLRPDIVEDRDGTPLRLGIRVVGHDGTPAHDATVEIWQCDALGRYSGFPPPDDTVVGSAERAATTQYLAEQTFLRGPQRTDTAGMVEFSTIVPGERRLRGRPPSTPSQSAGRSRPPTASSATSTSRASTDIACSLSLPETSATSLRKRHLSTAAKSKLSRIQLRHGTSSPSVLAPTVTSRGVWLRLRRLDSGRAGRRAVAVQPDVRAVPTAVAGQARDRDGRRQHCPLCWRRSRLAGVTLVTPCHDEHVISGSQHICAS